MTSVAPVPSAPAGAGAGGAPIRSLFETSRPIDRPIEKVIDYYATGDHRLRAEIEEYEVTENVEQNFRRFLDTFGHGVRTGQVAETGIWVAGFYGSGKSSFTKYLGFALDPARRVGDRPFLDLLAERIDSSAVRQDLRTLATQQPVAVIMLDLGSEQLASSSVATVTAVLYWKVLQWAGYSTESKLAQLEFRLDQEGRLEAFRRAYAARFDDGAWEDVHNSPLIGVSRAAQVVPEFFPREFPEPAAFTGLRFQLQDDARAVAGQIIDLVRRKTGRQNVLFLIDEVGQYVAPRGDLILNLDGLVRNLKELGEGRVWLVATGQQTLAEIVQRAAYNSAELTKLKDRFPIAIELDARDIREITARRLLGKSEAGRAQVADLFRRHGQALTTHTRLTGASLYTGDPDEQTFARLYPFLPQHFDLLMELVRTLARSTGGVGLRSAIRVIQDVLVDSSKVLPAGAPLLADLPVGHLATADLFFDTLRADIAKSLPHVVTGVERVARALPGDALALRLAKAIGALQAVEHLPRTADNLAALLYRRVGEPSEVDAVRDALRRLLGAKEAGLVDDPQAGGYTFLSEGVRPLRDKRDRYLPTAAEIGQLRSRLLQGLFEPAPAATLEGTKTVRAGVRLGRAPIVGEGEEVHFALELTDGAGWEGRRQQLLADTTGHLEWKAAIAWLIRPDEALDDVLVEAIRSRRIVQETPESDADRDVAQFVRAERRAADGKEDDARTLYRKTLLGGTLIFRGKPTPAQVAGKNVEGAARKVLQEAAAQIYPSYHLVNIRPGTDLAARFLGVERLDRMTREADPLGFVTLAAGRPRIDVQQRALAEALRAFRDRLGQQDTARLQGNAVQDLFAAAPYGWSKDATRYVFAALLQAGEVVFHTPSGPAQTAGPAAIDAVRTTQSFGRIGVSLRDSKPSLETVERAAARLQALLGVDVLPLEEHVSRAARERLPSRLDQVASLATQIRLLDLTGGERAQTLQETGQALLAGDGAAAVSVLGAVDCPFPEDFSWAERVVKALDSGAADDIRSARAVLRGADDLAGLFPVVALVEPTERETVVDVLASEDFTPRLADLRGVTRRVRERAAARYRDALVAYEADLATVRDAVEAQPEWVEIGEDDRQEVASHLEHDLPSDPQDGQEIDSLRTVLFKRSTLPALRRDLEGTVEEVARQQRAVRDGETQDKLSVDFVLEPLAARTVISTPEELEAWLDSVRDAITNALKAGAPVRLRMRQ